MDAHSRGPQMLCKQTLPVFVCRQTHLALNVLWIKSNRKQILIPISVLNHGAQLMRHMGCIRNGPHTPIHYCLLPITPLITPLL